MSNSPSHNQPSSHGKYLDQDTWEALKAAGYTDEQLYADQPFGPIIFSYTRKQAIEDGVLVDLTRPGIARILKRAGIVVHAAMTATCFAQTVCRELKEENLWETCCRLAAILIKFRGKALDEGRDHNRVDFSVEGIDGKPVAMYAHIGPGDEGEPVITFMLEGED